MTQTKFWWHHPKLGRQIQIGYVKLCFLTGREVSDSETKNLRPSATVVRVHEGGLAEGYRRCGSWFIIPMAHFRVRYDTCICNACALCKFQPSAYCSDASKNYADSRIKSDVSDSAQADTRSVCIIRTTGDNIQPTQDVARVSRR